MQIIENDTIENIWKQLYSYIIMTSGLHYLLYDKLT